MDDLEAMFERILEECIEQRKMKFPLVLCAVAANGAILAYKIHNPGRALWQLAGHSEPGDFLQWPINLMVVDRTGEAMRVKFDVNEGVTFH
ncbi:MAG TPA: hypothetical protein VMA30_01870 [Xanthobacteraceae bacterium]|nr:hypothetical protein [Xanthobacteraceae bacterium]